MRKQEKKRVGETERKRGVPGESFARRTVGVEPILDNGSTIGLSDAYTHFARTCNFKSSNQRGEGVGRLGGGISRSTVARLATKGEVILSVDLLSASILAEKRATTR